MTRYIEALVAFVLAAGLTYMAYPQGETKAPIRLELKWGAPTEGYVERVGYVHCPVGRYRFAAWTLEYLDATRIRGGAERSDNWRADADLNGEFRPTTEDYDRTGWDRGHFAPAADNAWHDAASRDSFILTNAAPQAPSINRGTWARIESYIRTVAIEPVTQVWVATIPIWAPDDLSPAGAATDQRVFYDVISGRHIPVPTHWGKVALIRNGSNTWGMSAWIVRNLPGPAPGMESCRCSCDLIEHWAGLDLWTLLPDELERDLERRSR